MSCAATRSWASARMARPGLLYCMKRMKAAMNTRRQDANDDTIIGHDDAVRVEARL